MLCNDVVIPLRACNDVVIPLRELLSLMSVLLNISYYIHDCTGLKYRIISRSVERLTADLEQEVVSLISRVKQGLKITEK